MYATELFEQNKPRVVVTYPGRFQPFHQGHAGVFSQLQKKFGAENVFVLTSNDTSSAKSPFDFSDKYQLITAAGVPANHIVETNRMYILPDSFDPSATVFVTAVGAPDKDRLNPDTVTKRDQKDKDGNITKPAGSPSYYRTWGIDENPVTADQHGYVVIIPEIRKNVKIKNKAYDASHGTEVRQLWNLVRNDPEARIEFLKQLYKNPHQDLVSIFNKIPETIGEDLAVTDGTDSTSPINGNQDITKSVSENTNPANTLYFFDVAQGGKSFSHIDLKVMGLRQTKSGKWYYQPGRDSTDLLINASLKHLEKTLNVPAKAWQRPVAEDAAGVGVVAKNKKMAKDPRYSMSMTKDVKPSTPKNMLRAFRLSEKWSAKYKKSIDCDNPKGFSQRAHCQGRDKVDEEIDPEDFHITNHEKLDAILVQLCKMIVTGKKKDSDYYGMVAACVLDTDNRAVFGINYADDTTGTRVHAERAALDQYRSKYGEPPSGSIIITTCSPCSQPMTERYGDSCTELINDTDIHKVYCGYEDPTQERPMNRTFHVMQTRNESIVELCRDFAKTFLGNDIKEDQEHGVKEKQMTSMIKEFLPLAMKELDLKKVPRIVLQAHVKNNGEQATFGRFDNSNETIYLGIADRHPVDVLRTLAHELVHFAQHQAGLMYPTAGETGSPIENEAHWVAGVIMRHFNKKYPDAIKMKPLALSENRKQGVTEARIIDDKRVDVYYRPIPNSRGRRVVAQNIPATALEPLLKKLSEKYAVPVESFEWTVAQGVAESQLNELGNAPAEHKPNRKRSRSLFHATVDGNWVDVFFDRSEFNDTLHITFAVNGDYDTPSQPTSASRSTVKILSTVLDIVKKQLPEYMAKARPPAVSFTAKGDNRTSLYRKYFVPVIQNILGPKWQHEEYPSMGMTVFHWRPVKKQGVTETFDQPYAVEWTKQNGDWHATADLDDGSELIVLFMAQGNNSWMVEFERDEEMDITGEGDAPRVFATVLMAMQQFIAKRKPARLNFSAEKEDDPTGSRARLYDRMLQRYITGTGYDLTREDMPGGATYTLTKQTPAVTEAVNRGDWVRHPDNPWQIGQIQNIDRDQALVTWKKTDKRKRAQSSTHPVNDLQHARREFSQLTQPTHSKPSVAEGKVKLYTDPNYFGAEVDDTGFNSLPVVNISADRLVGFEPDSKMQQPKSQANVEKIVAGLKKGDKLPPLLVRKYKNGYQVLDGHHRFWAYKLSGTKSIPVRIVADKDIEEISKQGVAEGVNDYLWHGSKSKHDILYPKQAQDTGGAEGSNKNAVYATPNAKFAIAMGLTTPGSDTGMFPNDSQMVLFSGKLRKGEYVYLHKVPKDLFIKHNGREWYSKPDVKEVKPLEVVAVPVDKYLNLIRQATPQDWKLRQHYLDKAKNKEQGVAEGLDDNGISFKVQKGKNKFATTLSVGVNPVGVYQYDADTGRSVAEVYPEFKGKGLGKLLVLHAIYTAAKLGLDFQEDESRTSEYDNVLDSLSSNGYIVDDDGYWYVTGEGEQYLKQSLKQDVAENFADGKNPGRKGLAKRSGVNTKASVSSLRKTAKHSSGEKQRMAHWLANMKAGRAKAHKK